MRCMMSRWCCACAGIASSCRRSLDFGSALFLFHVENSELPYTQTPWTSGSGGLAVDATAELTLMQYSDACDADEHVRPRIQPPQPHPSPSSFIPSTSLMSMHCISAYVSVRCFMPPNFSFSHAKSCLTFPQASSFLYPPILRER
jgi:hypothetical protein